MKKMNISKSEPIGWLLIMGYLIIKKNNVFDTSSAYIARVYLIETLKCMVWGIIV